MRQQAHQLTLLILDGHVADVPPVHHIRGQINQIVGLDGEEVCGHELAHCMVTVAPVLRFIRFDYWPKVYGFPSLLTPEYRFRESAMAYVARPLIFHRCERAQHPICSRLTALYALFEDA